MRKVKAIFNFSDQKTISILFYCFSLHKNNGNNGTKTKNEI